MRVALCVLALTVSGWAADVDLAESSESASPEQAQTTPAPADAPKPADAAKPADATPPAPPPKYGGWSFSALADGYSTYNNLHPAMGLNPLQNFDLHSGAPRLSLAKFT